MKNTLKWTPFEHRVYRHWKSRFPSHSKWLIACSGGLDSMALLHLTRRFQGALGLEIRVAYVHHGLSGNHKTDLYRAKAQKFVEKWCTENGVKCVTNPVGAECGRSEDEFRRLRYGFFNSVLKAEEWLVTAHHETDLLETRVLRLIRGVGPQGLKAMKDVDKKTQILRPLLAFSRAEIENYVKKKKIKFVQDPSNATEDYLRNWLRHDWLLRLEKKSPGAVKALARSLEAISEVVPEANVSRKSLNIPRKSLAALPRSKQKMKLARFLRQNGFSDYGQTHIEELLKRLDSARKRHTFELLGRTWNLDPQHLALKRDCE